jgi:hypothetical protein
MEYFVGQRVEEIKTGQAHVICSVFHRHSARGPTYLSDGKCFQGHELRLSDNQEIRAGSSCGTDPEQKAYLHDYYVRILKPKRIAQRLKNNSP